eukprot:g29296.t1
MVAESATCPIALVQPPQSQGFATIFGDNKILTALLVFVPIGLVAHQLEMNPTYVFTFNFLAIIPLAWLIGKSTEETRDAAAPNRGWAAAAGGASCWARRAGDPRGVHKRREKAVGRPNEHRPEQVEMLLCIAGIRNNEIGVVQCTLLGSILSNLLLVMGCAFLFGGLYFPIQTYNQAGAATQCSLMALSVFAIGLPTIYESEWEHMVEVSRWASVCLLGVYFAYLVFQLKTHASLFQDSSGGEEEEEHRTKLSLQEEEPDLSPVTAAIMLCICTVVTSFATDALIEAIKGTISEWKVSKEFIGIILLPIIGNAAEHYTAIKVAMQNKMDLSLGVAAGSSCQMALLVTPFTVLVGWCYGTEMTLNFHAFQLAVLLFSVFLVNTILNNGQSNWLEGYILLVTYFVVSLIYFFEGTEENTSLASID